MKNYLRKKRYCHRCDNVSDTYISKKIYIWSERHDDTLCLFLMCAMVCVSFIFASLTLLFEGASIACGMLPHCRFCCVRAGASRVVVVHISNASVFSGARAYVYCHRQRCFPDLDNEAEACMHETGEAQRGAYAQHTYHIERESERSAQVCVRMT